MYYGSKVFDYDLGLFANNFHKNKGCGHGVSTFFNALRYSHGNNYKGIVRETRLTQQVSCEYLVIQESEMYELNVTQDGMDAMLKLRELRQLWHQIGQFEDLLGREAYGEIESAMLKAMQGYETHIMEEIFDATNFGTGPLTALQNAGQAGQELSPVSLQS